MPKKQSIPDRDPPIQIQLIERRIYLIRGQKVMLDRDLAELYQVKPIALRQQVKRNLERFPKDFTFQLTEKEADLLVSQSVIPSKKASAVIFRTFSPKKVWQCCPAFCGASEQYKSMLP